MTDTYITIIKIGFTTFPLVLIGFILLLVLDYNDLPYKWLEWIIGVLAAVAMVCLTTAFVMFIWSI